MIKYLGSKRWLVPTLGRMVAASGGATAADLFTGTTRVAQELKRRGAAVWAVDTARYAEVFARCYVATDAGAVDPRDLREAIDALNGLPGTPGYVTRTFCRRSRFFQPKNGMRIDAIRSAIAERYAGTVLEPILLTSLIEAADRVDSTTGVQMAYLKSWAPRSHRDLELRPPALLPGGGHALRADAIQAARSLLPPVDVAYLDPPYNQHRYSANYHVWETLVAWDAPPVYGVACKRVDLRAPRGRSRFNQRGEIGRAVAELLEAVPARLVILSFSDEGWLSLEELVHLASRRGHVRVIAFDTPRYVGARIGIHDRAGRKVGRVSHLRNTEFLVIAGDRPEVEDAARAGLHRGASEPRRTLVPVEAGSLVYTLRRPR